MTDIATVLIVDDEPRNVDLLEQELAEADLRTLSAGSGEAALAVAARERPDLILLDVMMRGIDGFETCRRLKNDPATRHIPVIFLTALRETFDKVQAFGCGAVDYVTKPFESEELLARVGVHLALRREIEAHGRSKATIRALVEDGVAHGDAMIGRSAALARVREQIAQVAPTDSTVLVQGETGTGKELVARAIHDGSARRDRALVTRQLRGAAARAGRERAVRPREGRVHRRAAAAPRPLRAGRRRHPVPRRDRRAAARRAGQAAARAAGARVRARRRHAQPARRRARHRRHQPRPAGAKSSAGRFRADLFFRLNVFPIVLPPLRERRDDIAALLAALRAQHRTRASAGIATAWRPPSRRGRASTTGRATSASSRTWSNAR